MTEFELVVRQIKLHKERFIQRLLRNIRTEGDCFLWTGKQAGGRSGPGYPAMNLWDPEEKAHVRVQVHRLFVMLAIKRPIKKSHEAGHFMCHNRLCVRHVEEQTRRYNRGEANGRRARADCPF